MVVGVPYVMSAKHGLLTVDDRVEKYDETLKKYSKKEKHEWAEDVLSDLPNHYNTIVLFGGRDYVEPIKSMNEQYEIVDPFIDTSGNGQQMSVCGDIVRDVISGGEGL